MLWITSALAATWGVPGDYASLQAAFDSPTVASGDTLTLAPGTFDGAVLSNGKSLSVVGAGPATVLRRTGTGGVVIEVSSASDLDLRLITIDGQDANAGLFAQSGASVTVSEAVFVNGTDRSEPAPVGGACLLVQNATATVTASTFSSCDATNGAGGALRSRSGGTLTVIGSTIEANTSLGAGGALKVDNGGFVALVDTLVTGNTSGSNGGGASIDGELSVTGGAFVDNDAPLAGGAIHSTAATAIVIVDGTVFSGNQAGTAGGAVAGAGNTTLERARLEGNAANTGGALAPTGPLSVRNVYACGNTAIADGHVIDSAPGVLDVANLLSVGNGDGAGLVNALDGNVRHSTFAYDQGTTLARVEGGLFADNVIASVLAPTPTALNVLGTTPSVYNNLVWGGTIAASIDTQSLADDPGMVLAGSSCTDLFSAYASNVTDRSALMLSDPDGTPADLGHLGGPDVDGAWWGADNDGDGSLVPSDCDDDDPSRNPSAQEVCDGLDNDCDGFVDDADGDLIASLYYYDGDGDGWAPATSGGTPFCNPPAAYVARIGDCNDSEPTINEGAIEACPDGLDNDCDLLVDSADPDYTDQAITLYLDADQDGVGTSASSVDACSDAQPVGYVPASYGNDCDDTNPVVSPIEPEICDAFDNNCNGQVNEGFLTSPYYPDADMDGYGSLVGVVLSCAPQPGMVNNDDDCDDTDPDVNPGQTEVCDGVDQNCTGVADEGLPTTTWYVDSDGDGYGDATDPGTADCLTLTGHVTNAGDCDDASASVNPGQAEVPDDGIDNDCDGTDFESPVLDSDGDGIPDDIDPDPFSAGDLTGDAPDPTFGCGCQSGGSAAWLAPFALVLVRRRQAR
ncbi:MAG: putative metal-binding motif-containing protein [Alphaproteobacteria bacterium]|nr:putative metal-binding motif-containing protein [Alphaproteobacteria bacterium]